MEHAIQEMNFYIPILSPAVYMCEAICSREKWKAKITPAISEAECVYRSYLALPYVITFTVLSTKSDNGVFCLQSDQGLIIDRSLVF